MLFIYFEEVGIFTHLYTSHSLSRSFLLIRWCGTFLIAAQVSLYFSLYTFPKQPCASVLVEYAIYVLLRQLQTKLIVDFYFFLKTVNYNDFRIRISLLSIEGK